MSDYVGASLILVCSCCGWRPGVIVLCRGYLYEQLAAWCWWGRWGCCGKSVL